MHEQTLLSTVQNLDWVRLIHNYHTRHYIWEISKILIPALLTGLITIVTMRIIDSKNKKRWLNDGHLKRKIELEIEIRRYLLGIKAITSNHYEILADWEENPHVADAKLVYSFNKNFEKLYSYLQNEEDKDESYNYNKIFALMDEYECYIPKIKELFTDFKVFYEKVLELKNIFKNGQTESAENTTYTSVFEETKKRPDHFIEMINTYLCFQLVIENILKKLTVKKLIK